MKHSIEITRYPTGDRILITYFKNDKLKGSTHFDETDYKTLLEALAWITMLIQTNVDDEQ